MSPSYGSNRVAELEHLICDRDTAQDIYRWLLATGWFNRSDYGQTFRAHQALDEQQKAINTAREALYQVSQSNSNQKGPREPSQQLQYTDDSQAPHSPGSSTDVLSEIIVQQENFEPHQYSTQDPDTRSYYDEERSRRNSSRRHRDTNHHRPRSQGRTSRSQHSTSHRPSDPSRGRSHNRRYRKSRSHSHTERYSGGYRGSVNHHEFSCEDSSTYENEHHGGHGRQGDTDGRRSATPKHWRTSDRGLSRYRERSRSCSPRVKDQYERDMDYEQSEQVQRLNIVPAPTATQPSAPSSAGMSQPSTTLHNEKHLSASSAVTKSTRRYVANSKPQDRDQQKEKDNLIHPKPFNPGEPGQTRFFVIRSYNYANIYQAQNTGIWATQKTNEAVLVDAFNTCNHVILFFGVNTGPFYGYAKMTSLPSLTTSAPSWYRYLKMEATDPFHIEWYSTAPCETHHVGHVRNAFNDDLPVTRSRDGQEISEAAGLEVLRIMSREARKMCNGGSIFGMS